MNLLDKHKNANGKAPSTRKTAKKNASAVLCILCVSAFAVLCAAVIAVMGAVSGVEYLGSEGVTFQQGPSDCGAASLWMIFRHHGLPVSYTSLLSELQPAPTGLRMLDLKAAAERHGLACAGWQLDSSELAAIPLPALLFLRRGHFVVLESRTPAGDLILLDPARGRLKVTERRLISTWGGETLLFTQPSEAAGRGNRWFAASSTRKE